MKACEDCKRPLTHGEYRYVVGCFTDSWSIVCPACAQQHYARQAWMDEIDEAEQA